jgi:hypothetical protein
MSYGIGTAARLTGLTTHTIRAWESRHQAIAASRDTGGRRRYSPADVERLTKLKQLTDLGERIGALAGLSTAALDERLTAMGRDRGPTLAPVPRLQVGVYGQGAVALADTLAQMDGHWSLVDTQVDASPTSLHKAPPDGDCLILELASLAPGSVETLEALSRDAGRRALILIYGFARDQDLQRLARAGTIILRAPVGADDLKRALDEVTQQRLAAAALAQVVQASSELAERPRFTAAELTRIGQISTSIDCECPHHLVTLISNLRAFESYSADCTNRNTSDAAMHEFLYRETLRANLIMESALRQLIEYEGIDVAN